MAMMRLGNLELKELVSSTTLELVTKCQKSDKVVFSAIFNEKKSLFILKVYGWSYRIYIISGNKLSLLVDDVNIEGIDKFFSSLKDIQEINL